VKYIPVNEKVELELGPADQVLVEPKCMESRTENHLFDKDGNVNGWDDVQTWNMKLTNARDFLCGLSLPVDSTRSTGTSRRISKRGYAKHDMTHARFTLELPPLVETDSFVHCPPVSRTQGTAEEQVIRGGRSMRGIIKIGAALACMALVVLPAQARIKLVALPERADTVIRLDNPQATLIEEERVLTLQKGLNKIDFSWRGVNVDEDSIRLQVLSHPKKVKLLNVSYPPGRGCARVGDQQ